MRCWQCGAEPEETFDISTFGGFEPRVLARWATRGDHYCDERPPTPAQLEHAGHRALMRIRELAS